MRRGERSVRLAHCRSARSRTLTAQQLGVWERPEQRRGAWRLAGWGKVGIAVARVRVVVRRRGRRGRGRGRCMVGVVEDEIGWWG